MIEEYTEMYEPAEIRFTTSDFTFSFTLDLLSTPIFSSLARKLSLREIRFLEFRFYFC